MANKLVWLIPVTFILSCSQQDAAYRAEIELQRAQANAAWMSGESGLLDSAERNSFKGLQYFDVNSDYRCEAKIMWYPQTTFFDMPHTDGAFRPYMKVGELHLRVKGNDIVLHAYQTEKMRLQRTLFVPFADKTNGIRTYDGGRYLDVPYAPQSSRCMVDFNTAYAPYCAHSKNYSCPVVPGENQLAIAIEAGEKY